MEVPDGAKRLIALRTPVTIVHIMSVRIPPTKTRRALRQRILGLPRPALPDAPSRGRALRRRNRGFPYKHLLRAPRHAPARLAPGAHYSLAADGLYLHLYEPSTIRWQQDGAALALTVATRFPFDTGVNATFQTASPVRSRIRVRVPIWAAGPCELRVNGTPAGSGTPSSYVTLDRVWSDGDRIEFTLAPALIVRRYAGADQIPGKVRISVEYGPILLAAIGASKVDLEVEPGAAPESLARLLEPVPGSRLHFNVRGNPGARLMPYWQIETEEFNCYPTVVVRA